MAQATVTEATSQPIGLAAQDFEVRDDGVEQTVELVDTADVPLWQYHLAAGRDADDLLTALWASVPR